MSLYNMLFGENPAAPFLLAMLGTNQSAVPRYRNCYIDDGKIAIHTRTGGGNRDDYVDENASLCDLPGYLYDCDDSFDCTYATFYYSFPEEYKADLEALAANIPMEKPSEQWEKLIAKLKERPCTN